MSKEDEVVAFHNRLNDIADKIQALLDRELPGAKVATHDDLRWLRHPCKPIIELLVVVDEQDARRPVGWFVPTSGMGR